MEDKHKGNIDRRMKVCVIERPGSVVGSYSVFSSINPMKHKELTITDSSSFQTLTVTL